MTIRFACPCGKHLKARDDFAGRRLRCPGCQVILTIPDALPQLVCVTAAAALTGAEAIVPRVPEGPAKQARSPASTTAAITESPAELRFASQPDDSEQDESLPRQRPPAQGDWLVTAAGLVFMASLGASLWFFWPTLFAAAPRPMPMRVETAQQQPPPDVLIAIPPPVLVPGGGPAENLLPPQE